MQNDKAKQSWHVPGRLEGSKKGGGGPTEDPDTLRSRAEASVLAVFCEGEIQGFPPGASVAERNQRIFIDDTALVDKDGNSNFDDGVNVSFAAGSQAQPSLPGFNDVRIEQTIGIKVIKQVGPVSRATTSSTLDRIYVRIGVASLFEVEEDGDIRGTKVEFIITIADSLGAVVISEKQQIKGKTRGAYDREYNYVVAGSVGPWTVKVERLTNDPKDLKFNNDLYFKAIVGVVEQTLTYPNSALLGISVSAENFQSVPVVSARLLGMRIQVPSNYNRGSNTYTGVWNGTFKTEYNNNPVWVFYDLLTNPRYGCGSFINAADVDVYSLLPIAQYCDEMVADGKGGMEKRFEFNAYINNRGDAYEVLNSLAAAFRGMIYYAQGKIIATQDRPGSVIRQFSPANVVVEVDESGQVTRPPFVYEGTALKARKTVALVSWNDRDDKFRTKIEYVEDRSAIERYGYREIEVRALGCTSQGQAQRVGRWTLLTNLNETETVTFRVTAEGFFLMPGEVIEIADPYKSIGIYAGTLASAGTAAVILDREVTLVAGKSYEVIIRSTNDIDITRTITNGPGVTDSISFSPALLNPPPLPAAWIIREANAEPRKYRVVALNEDGGVVTVLATSYYEDKYDEVDSNTMLSSQTTSIAGLKVRPIVSAGSIVFAAT